MEDRNKKQGRMQYILINQTDNLSQTVQVLYFGAKDQNYHKVTKMAQHIYKCHFGKAELQKGERE